MGILSSWLIIIYTLYRYFIAEFLINAALETRFLNLNAHLNAQLIIYAHTRTVCINADKYYANVQQLVELSICVHKHANNTVIVSPFGTCNWQIAVTNPRT